MRERSWPRILASSGARSFHATNPATTTTSRMNQNMPPAYVGASAGRDQRQPDQEAEPVEQLGDAGLLEHRDQARAGGAGQDGAGGARARHRRTPGASSAHHDVASGDGDDGDGGEAEQQDVEARGCGGRRARTASVRLPATRSVGMSRRLLATRIAQASAPMPTAAYSAAHSQVSVWTYVVPITATRPKKTKTITSPSPR